MFFHRCYEGTYREHHSTPYLSLDFFLRIGATMPDNLLLVIGSRGGRRLCAALDVFDAAALWGRYWGTLQYIPGLHFEACYYQAIEFCIERRIARSKAARRACTSSRAASCPSRRIRPTRSPTRTSRSAIADFCRREQVEIAHMQDELAGLESLRG